MAQWFCTIGGQRYGPVTQDVLRQWYLDRRLGLADLVWCEGMPNWVPVATVSDLITGIPLDVPPAPATANPELKSKLAAGLLGILVGAFGVHNFYLGFTNKGLVQLLLTVLTCGIAGVATSIWGLIEGIMILTGSINCDAQGRPLRD